MESTAIFLAGTPTLDCDNPVIGRFVEKHISKTMSQQDAAIALYYAVRDQFRYDPYRLDLTTDGMKASTTVVKGYGWCVTKAILLAACCRYIGIPARLGFGDVCNHLTTERLREWMQTDVFYWHGYTDILINDRWVKATPAFNLALCEKFGILPLEFDGESDSIFHPFDASGNKHMEYINNRGTYADLPLNEIIDTFQEHYSMLLGGSADDFVRDVISESQP